MRVLQALETEYSLLRSINSSEGDFFGRMLATGVLAGQVAPLLSRLFMSAENFSAMKALLVYAGCFILALLLIDSRREKLPFWTAKEIGLPQRLTLVLFIFVTSVALFSIAGSWPYLAIIGYILVSMFPLHLFVKVKSSSA